MSTRFNTSDRQQVIDLLNRHFDANFVRFPTLNYRKLLWDEKNDAFVVIFGGVGGWHGIDEEFMDTLTLLSQSKSTGYIVLAEKAAVLDVFVGPLNVFVKEKDSLIRNQDGDYQFHHERHGDIVILKENSNLELELIGNVAVE